MSEIKIENPKTFEKKVIQIDDKQEIAIIAEFKEEVLSDDILNETINNLDIPAELKVILSEIRNFTMTVGGVAVKLGRRIIEILLYMIKENPKTAMGLLIGSLIGFIFSSIPAIGWALGWLIQPICMILGLSIGFIQDIKDEELKQQVKSTVSETFRAMKDIKI